MKESYRDLIEMFHMFHQLNFSALLPEDLSKGGFFALCAIDKCQKKCVSDGDKVQISKLVDELQVLPPAVSRTLRSLEEKGYIERSIDEKDRRNTCVKITEEGRRAMKDAGACLDEFAESVFSQTSEEDLHRVCAYLQQVYETAKEEINQRRNSRKKETKS